MTFWRTIDYPDVIADAPHVVAHFLESGSGEEIESVIRVPLTSTNYAWVEASDLVLGGFHLDAQESSLMLHDEVVLGRSLPRAG